MSGPMTWLCMTTIEPELLELEAAARTRPPEYDSYRFWSRWSFLKARLSRLAGWTAKHPELGSSYCYDVAYRHLLNVYESAALSQGRGSGEAA